MKLNCWEAMSCERHPGGAKVDDLGICPAATESVLHGINGGVNGGRSCWGIINTLCGDRVQGNITNKLFACINCDFYAAVRAEEGKGYASLKTILARGYDKS